MKTDEPNEVSFLKKLDHPNIVKLHEIYENEEYIFLVQELCESQLIDYFKMKGGISEKDLAVICSKILSALAYCHRHGVIHRDIKFQNILLGNVSDLRTLKLIDFGLSAYIGDKQSELSKATGTAIYLAPEVISGNYDEKADIWSLGVLLYYLVTGQPPFRGRNMKELYMDILMNSGYKTLFSDEWIAQNPIGDLMKRMLVHLPSQRAPAEELLYHPWLSSDSLNAENHISIEVIEKIHMYMQKSSFLKLLCYHYSAKWRDSYCDSLKQALETIDQNRDGIISLDEFTLALLNCNTVLNEEIFPPSIIESIFVALDVNNNGQIDYSEFQMLFSQMDLSSDENRLKEIFQKLDPVSLKNITGRQEMDSSMLMRSSNTFLSMEFFLMMKPYGLLSAK